MEENDSLKISNQEENAGFADKPQYLFIIGGALLSLLHQWMRPSLPEEERVITYVFFGFGLLSFLFGVWCDDRKRFPDWLSRFLEYAGSALHFQPVKLLAIFYAILLSITATVSSGFGVNMYQPWVSMLSWGVAIILVIYAGWERPLVGIKLNKKILLSAAAVFLVAFFVRAVDTVHIPIVLSGDESSSGLHAIHFMNGDMNNVFIGGWYSFPSLFYLFQSVGIRLLGHTTEGLRIPAAFIGSLTVALLFIVIQRQFGSRQALITAAFLAFSHFHINFSRIGLNNIWDGLGFVVALGSLWWGWKTERRAAFLLSGLAIGFSMYLYTSARGILLVIPVWLALAAIQDWKRFKRMLPNLALMVLTAFVIVLPLAWFFTTHPQEFFAPMNRVSILGEWLDQKVIETGKPAWQVLFTQMSAALLAYTDMPLRHWYTPGVPILRQAEAWIFYLGLGLILLRLKDNRLWIPLIWLAVFGVAGAFSDSTPAAQRYVAAAPAVAIVLGYAVERVIGLADRLWNGTRKFIPVVIMIAALAIAVDDARFYFFDFTPRSDFSGPHGMAAQKLADYLKDYDDSWEVMFSGWPQMGYYSIPSLSYLRPQILGTDIDKQWGDPENMQPTRKNVMFVFLPSHEEDLRACQEQYPGGKLITEYYTPDQVLYYLYEVRLQ